MDSCSRAVITTHPDTEFYVFAVLKTESSKSRCPCVWCLLKPHSLACRRLYFSNVSHGVPLRLTHTWVSPHPNPLFLSGHQYDGVRTHPEDLILITTPPKVPIINKTTEIHKVGLQTDQLKRYNSAHNSVFRCW